MKKLMIAAIFSMFGSGAAAAECDHVSADYAFCPTVSWERLEGPIPDGVYIWKKKDITGKLIVEPYVMGSVPEITEIVDALQGSVSSSFPDPSIVSFREPTIQEIGGSSVGTIVYDLDFVDGPLTVYHSILVANGAMMQYTTVSRWIDPAMGTVSHREFVSSFKATAVDSPA